MRHHILKVQVFFLAIMCLSLVTGCSSVKNKEQISTKKNMAADFAALGNNSFEEGYYSRALEYFRSSLDYASSVDFREGVAKAWNSLARTYLAMGDAENALYASVKAKDIALEEDFSQELSIAYHNLGEGELHASRYEEALVLFDKAMDLLSAEQAFSEEAALLLHVRGVTLKKLGKTDEALSDLKKALEINKKNKNSASSASNNYMLGLCYREKGDREQALAFLNEALVLDKKIERSLAIAADLKALGQMARDDKNYSLAEELNLRAYMVYKGQGLKDRMQNALDVLTEISREAGWSEKADFYIKTKMDLKAL